ncbi:hypothetical protein SAMN05444370_1771, partial [Rubrimonas cliftonensis]
AKTSLTSPCSYILAHPAITISIAYAFCCRSWGLGLGRADINGIRWQTRQAGGVAALAQLRDAQFDRAGPRLPGPVTVAVAARARRSALFSPQAAPVRPPASISIGRSAAQPASDLHPPSFDPQDRMIAARPAPEACPSAGPRQGPSPPGFAGSSSRRSSGFSGSAWLSQTRHYRRPPDGQPLRRHVKARVRAATLPASCTTSRATTRSARAHAPARRRAAVSATQKTILALRWQGRRRDPRGDRRRCAPGEAAQARRHDGRLPRRCSGFQGSPTLAPASAGRGSPAPPPNG